MSKKLSSSFSITCTAQRAWAKPMKKLRQSLFEFRAITEKMTMYCFNRSLVEVFLFGGTVINNAGIWFLRLNLERLLWWKVRDGGVVRRMAAVVQRSGSQASKWQWWVDRGRCGVHRKWHQLTDTGGEISCENHWQQTSVVQGACTSGVPVLIWIPAFHAPECCRT